MRTESLDAVTPASRSISGRSLGVLIAAKSLDSLTTWYGLRHALSAHESNPFAAEVFRAVGLEPGLLLLGTGSVLLLVVAVEGGSHFLRTRTATSGDARRLLVYMGYVAPALFFLTVAAYNCRVFY